MYYFMVEVETVSKNLVNWYNHPKIRMNEKTKHLTTQYCTSLRVFVCRQKTETCSDYSPQSMIIQNDS